jgi:ribonuclease BN (tRNA processing enzyme)
MTVVIVQFLGSGDAFGSGGRLQPCISVRTEDSHVLVDCGASALIGMRQQGIDPATIDAVVVTHLHGDHFGGLPFLVLDAQFRRGERPLLLAGPPGLRERVGRAMEVFFPGSSGVERRFELRFLEIPERTETAVGPLAVTGYEVPHPSGAPAYALRLVCEGKVIAYSGDGEWSEALVEAARGAVLFICEAYSYEKSIRHHLSYATLRRHRERLECRRIVLTHMSADMLAHRSEVSEELAEDGLTLSLEGRGNRRP